MTGLAKRGSGTDLNQSARWLAHGDSAREDRLLATAPPPAWLESVMPWSASPLPRLSAPAVFNLAALDGGNGFRIDGIEADDQSGFSVSSAGDFNGDGFDDILIGARLADPDADPYAGESYVVFGKADGFAASLGLASLDGGNGFRINGVDRFDYSGSSVSSAGDVNGDGFDDIIIGAYGADAGGDYDAGESYVVFGKASGFAASMELASLDGTHGFRLDGVDDEDKSGFSVSSAGDVNGDGFGDIIIGAYRAEPDGDIRGGESYVVFGKASGFAASLSLATLNGTSGFRIDGIDKYDYSGVSVASAGDVNGDGFDDIIIGAVGVEPGTGEQYTGNGESYVVFGKANGFAASLDLVSLNGANGFRIVGSDEDDYSGISVSSAGDVNGDGFDDIIIGAAQADPDGHSSAGESYVVFGKASGFGASFNLASLNGSNGFRIDGVDVLDFSGFSVSSAGDFNGDGFDDIIIGAYYGDPGAGDAGESYVVFGKAGGFAGSLDLASLNGVNGFRVEGIDADDNSGLSVSSAGDVNGDGFDDIIIGAPFADSNGDRAGESYVIFGFATGGGGETIVGTGGPDSLVGGPGEDSLRGLAGNDTLRGGDGGDTLNGGTGSDWADYRVGGAVRADLATPSGNTGNAESDSYVSIENLRGSGGRDRLYGDNLANRIDGLANDDILVGRGGNDRLSGGAGKDTLTGGGGGDRFDFASTSAADADMVNDFAAGTDTIGLDAEVFGLPEGVLNPARFVLGTAAGDANDRLIYQQSTGRLWFDADGSGAGAKVLLATFDNLPTIGAGDFVVI